MQNKTTFVIVNKYKYLHNFMFT